MNVLFGTAVRQTTGFVETLLYLIGLDWDVPDCGTLGGNHMPFAVNIPRQAAQRPPPLLVGGTRIKVEGEGEWNARTRGSPKHHGWSNVHLGISEETLKVRAVEIISGICVMPRFRPNCSARSC